MREPIQRHETLSGSAHVTVTPLAEFGWPPTEYIDARTVQPAPETVAVLEGWRAATVEVESARVRVRVPLTAWGTHPTTRRLPVRFESMHGQLWTLSTGTERAAPPLGFSRDLAPRVTLVRHAELTRGTIWVWLIAGAEPDTPLAVYAELALRNGPCINCLVVGGGTALLLAAAHSLSDLEPI